MEGYYEARTVTCQACAARDLEAADQHGQGVKVGVSDESYAVGYEPSLAADKTPRQQGDTGEASHPSE